jgi:hypothetical protein
MEFTWFPLLMLSVSSLWGSQSSEYKGPPEVWFCEFWWLYTSSLHLLRRNVPEYAAFSYETSIKLKGVASRKILTVLNYYNSKKLYFHRQTLRRKYIHQSYTALQAKVAQWLQIRRHLLWLAGYWSVNFTASTFTGKPKGGYIQPQNGIRTQKPSAGWVERTSQCKATVKTKFYYRKLLTLA